MAAKQKANTKTITLFTSAVSTFLLALLASPVLVEYIKQQFATQSTPPAPTTVAAVPPASEPSVVEEQCLKKAWDAFNGTRYENAIKFAEQCIDNFGKTADRAQEKLDNENEPPPPTGKVSAAEKEEILKRGLLNDVATAYFIKGRSAEYLYRSGAAKSAEYKNMAKEAYEATCRYKHGRTWDTQGWFWSPCEAASDRLPLK